MKVQRLDALDTRDVAQLADVLCACVEAGASVSFMAPFARSKAEAFWREVAASVARGERALIVATNEQGTIIGTVQVIWATPENQPHRADVAKMLVTPQARRRGVGAALLVAAEREAASHGRTLLVLDTADATAARLYARGGWTFCGEIPDYALWPTGGYCATQIFFKSLRQPSGSEAR